MKRSEQTNKKLENIVKSSGVDCKLDSMSNKIVIDDEWNIERETMAKELLAKDTSVVPTFWQNKYEMEAAKNWDLFYKRNTVNFYKDRHYIHKVFPELVDEDGMNQSRALIEVGCGVGNAALPLLSVAQNLHVYAVDFSSAAIAFIKKQPLYDANRCTALVQDMAGSIPESLLCKMNYATCLFCLSAIHPSKMHQVAVNIAKTMKPGGKLMFRDYGRYDQAQLRFGPGQKLMENFYIRQDLTRAYYFTLEEIRDIFEKAGFVVEELEYIRRQYMNRKQGVSRFRVWIHAKFRFGN